jgi:hypothetical protein
VSFPIVPIEYFELLNSSPIYEFFNLASCVEEFINSLNILSELLFSPSIPSVSCPVFLGSINKLFNSNPGPAELFLAFWKASFWF